MSFQLPTQRRQATTQASWSGTAFIVESMLLLVFLVASLAVFTQLFAKSGVRAQEAEDLSRALAAASNTAERFAVDPKAAPLEEYTSDGLRVTCRVTAEVRDGGTMYHAEIAVYDANANASANATSDNASAAAADAAVEVASGSAAAAATAGDAAAPGLLYSMETARYVSEVG